jgi:predicted nucleotidyltransferase
MEESPRRTWVIAHAAELVELAAKFGARRMCLCGSVARRTDTDKSDIDFYVWDFDGGEPGTIESLEARRRADDLVKAIRAMCPYNVDVRGIPGWLLDPPFELTMRRDAVDLRELMP